MLTVNTINDTFVGLEKGYSVVFLKQKVRKMNNMEKVFNTAVAILATFFYVSIWWLGFSFKDF